MKTLQETIETRRSVRTFDGNELKEEDKKAIEEYFSEPTNPFGVDVAFKILDAKENDLSSAVIVGEKQYLAAKVKRVENFEIACGYSFENVSLFAASLGVGTVMLAASLSRATLEKAMEVKEDEVMPVGSPIGYPGSKMSIRETLMRKALKADERKPFETLFFQNDFNTPLKEEDAGIYKGALSALRLAPSATNGQPWRAVVVGEAVHFVEVKTMKDSPIGDVQKFDMGIALSHFDLMRKEQGIKGKFTFDDPGIELPKNALYIATFRKE